MAKAKPTKKLSEDELLDLGKKLQAFYDMGYVNRHQALLWSFLKGLAGGFGALVGSTLVIALLLWILSFFNQLPFLHSIDQALQSAIHKR
jgi:hypothetical protein